MHLFHSWDYKSADVRHCTKCPAKQGYSDDLRKWTDLGYLETTTYDNMFWLKLPSHLR